MKARFLEMLAEGRWIDGLCVYAGMGLVFALYQGWL